MPKPMSAFTEPQGPYFLSHSVGLLPRAAPGVLAAAYFTPWAKGEAATWPAWLSAIDAFRASLAGLIGAEADDICPQTNVSSALTKVLSALPVAGKRRRIVFSDEDFPTIGYVFGEARRFGFEPHLLKGGPHLADPDAWRDGYADDVHMLHVTHVFSNLGLKAPVAEIVARAKAAGAVTVVDAAQSAGAVEIDVRAWNADFVTGTSVKYLCGGNGAGWLWVNPETAPKCAPADVGWFSHENPFEFDIRRFAYAPRAARFWGGTPSVAPFAIARAGIDAVARGGIARVSAHNQGLLDRLLAATPESAVASHARKGERGCAVLLRPKDLAGAKAALESARVAHDERKGALRFSVHLYNTAEEVDRLAQTIAPFL